MLSKKVVLVAVFAVMIALVFVVARIVMSAVVMSSNEYFVHCKYYNN
jgi:hypothetical protein